MTKRNSILLLFLFCAISLWSQNYLGSEINQIKTKVRSTADTTSEVKFTISRVQIKGFNTDLDYDSVTVLTININGKDKTEIQCFMEVGGHCDSMTIKYFNPAYVEKHISDMLNVKYHQWTKKQKDIYISKMIWTEIENHTGKYVGHAKLCINRPKDKKDPTQLILSIPLIFTPK